MRLRNQFLLTLLVTSVVVLAAMVVLIQASFERSLAQYLDQRQKSLLQGLSQEFAEYYDYYGSFEGITLRTLLWNMEAGEERRIPPDLVLLDADRTPIFGPPVPDDSLQLVPVETDSGVVGWVGLPAGPEYREARARGFEQRQQRFLATIAMFALVLTIIGAVWLSRRLIRPIETVAAFSEQLRHGQYDGRIANTRSDEIGKLTAAMNVLAETLSSTQKARQRWLADMAHELRTPVTVLRGEIEAIQDGIREAGPDALTRLHQQVAHIGALLDDLHDLSLADAGALRYQMQPVDLRTVCEQASKHLQASALELSLNLPVEPCTVYGDLTRLRQLLDNLLSNSSKYTAAGGQIKISLKRASRMFLLVVEDSAPGVNDQQLARLFEYLYRTESSRNRKTGGAGLGLAICKRIVAAHQGTITAGHSRLGGVRISIELPEYRV